MFFTHKSYWLCLEKTGMSLQWHPADWIITLSHREQDKGLKYTSEALWLLKKTSFMLRLTERQYLLSSRWLNLTQLSMSLCLYFYMYSSVCEFYTTCSHCQWFPISHVIISHLRIPPHCFLLSLPLLPPALLRLWVIISSQLLMSVSRYLAVSVSQAAHLPMCTFFKWTSRKQSLFCDSESNPKGLKGWGSDVWVRSSSETCSGATLSTDIKVKDRLCNFYGQFK